ncbi:hypothetical protein [Bifidobacterium biavatii]|uniref:Signal transduction histidine kinase-like protein n=1 Tax=Bifidobacterium biavatii DSM 23969 TaxID=1437608 RepID=A0A086ZS41_9BIFI|nr:hypothetical protein [Bifidobacterium biavatii]KFI49341.1 Signal transduction histidine kinase-like protein [Bifidobacterium biavatii DSM 23969]
MRDGIMRMLRRMPARTWPSILLAAVTVWWLLFERVSGVQIAASCVQAALLLASIRFPVGALVLFLLVDAVLTPLGVVTFALPGALYSIGMIAYCTSDIVAVAIIIAMSMQQTAQTAFLYDSASGLDWRNYPTFIAMYALSAMFGVVLRRNKQYYAMLRRNERIQARIDAMDRNLYTAMQIHDAVTGDLSSIVQMSRRAQRHATDDAEAEWHTVEQLALKALSSVHQVIERLETGGEAPSEPANVKEAIARIQEETDRCEALLAKQGFVGHATLQQIGYPTDVPAASIDVIIMLLRELSANIIRHAAPGSRYQISVLVNVSGCDVSSVNPATRPDEEAEFPGGHGLAQQRAAVERAGGYMSAIVDNGEWLFHAHVPLPRI